MNRILLLPVALLAATRCRSVGRADTKTVQITKGGFTPSSTAVMVGDSVTWHNADAVDHQVVANDGTFASPVLKTGENYTFTFAKATKVTVPRLVRDVAQGHRHRDGAGGQRLADDVDADRDLRRQHDRLGRGLEPAHERAGHPDLAAVRQGHAVAREHDDADERRVLVRRLADDPDVVPGALAHGEQPVRDRQRPPARRLRPQRWATMSNHTEEPSDEERRAKERDAAGGSDAGPSWIETAAPKPADAQQSTKPALLAPTAVLSVPGILVRTG